MPRLHDRRGGDRFGYMPTFKRFVDGRLVFSDVDAPAPTSSSVGRQAWQRTRYGQNPAPLDRRQGSFKQADARPTGGSAPPRRHLLAQTAAALGRRCASERRLSLQLEGRRIAGGWPEAGDHPGDEGLGESEPRGDARVPNDRCRADEEGGSDGRRIASLATTESAWRIRYDFRSVVKGAHTFLHRSFD